MILRTQDGTWCCTRSGPSVELRRPDGRVLCLTGNKLLMFLTDLGVKYDRGEPLKQIFAQLWRTYV